MDFNSNFQKLYVAKQEHNNCEPVVGFQNHAAERLGDVIARLERGDYTAVQPVLDDDQSFDHHVDYFDVMDQMAENDINYQMADESEEVAAAATHKGNSSSSNSQQPGQPLGNAQAAEANSGDEEIAGKSE